MSTMATFKNTEVKTSVFFLGEWNLDIDQVFALLPLWTVASRRVRCVYELSFYSLTDETSKHKLCDN